MIPCQELKAKRRIRVKNSYESNRYQNKVLNHLSTKLPKFFSICELKINTFLTQKDTMDRGAWIKNSERKACRKTHMKSTKVQKHKKCKMAWEWGTNEYFCLPYVTILWCPSWKLPEDRGNKWNLSSWPQNGYLDLEILVSILLNWTTLNVWKYIYCLWEIHISRRIQHGGFIIKQSVTRGRNCPEV